MATRMTTLLYGNKPEADVEPGNRVDTVNGGPHAAPPPMRPHERALAEHAQARPLAMRGLVLGLAAASAVLAGLTIALIPFAWSRSITPGAQVALVVLGLFLFAGGLSFVVSSPTQTTTR